MCVSPWTLKEVALRASELHRDFRVKSTRNAEKARVAMVALERELQGWEPMKERLREMGSSLQQLTITVVRWMPKLMTIAIDFTLRLRSFGNNKGAGCCERQEGLKG